MNYVLVGIVTGALVFSSGYYLGSKIEEQKCTAEISKLQIENNKKNEELIKASYNTTKTLQQEQDNLTYELDKLYKESEQKISHLNKLINSYKLRINKLRNESKCTMSDPSSSKLNTKSEDKNQRGREIDKLFRITRDLAVERDEIAKKYNLLLDIYNKSVEKLEEYNKVNNHG